MTMQKATETGTAAAKAQWALTMKTAVTVEPIPNGSRASPNADVAR